MVCCTFYIYSYAMYTIVYIVLLYVRIVEKNQRSSTICYHNNMQHLFTHSHTHLLKHLILCLFTLLLWLFFCFFFCVVSVSWWLLLHKWYLLHTVYTLLTYIHTRIVTCVLLKTLIENKTKKNKQVNFENKITCYVFFLLLLLMFSCMEMLF